MTTLSDAISDRESELLAARDAALEAVQVKPTGANRKAYRKACRELEEFLRAKQEPDSGEQTFASILDVVQYLDKKAGRYPKVPPTTTGKKKTK